MTIEKEAREISENIVETYLHKSLQENNKMFNGIEIAIAKALQTKQDRILQLEEQLREYKFEWESACEQCNTPRMEEYREEIIALFKECVPEEVETPHKPDDEWDGGWNDCRTATLKNIEELR